MTNETENGRTQDGSADIPRIYYDLRRRNHRRARVAAILVARREERFPQLNPALFGCPRPGRTRA